MVETDLTETYNPIKLRNLDNNGNSLLFSKKDTEHAAFDLAVFLFVSICIPHAKMEYLLMAFWSTTVSVLFYSVAVYANASYLIPSFYKKESKKLLYFLFPALFLVVLVLIRVLI